MADKLLLSRVSDEAQTLAYIIGIDSHILHMCMSNRQYQNIDKQGPTVKRAMKLEQLKHLDERAFGVDEKESVLTDLFRHQCLSFVGRHKDLISDKKVVERLLDLATEHRDAFEDHDEVYEAINQSGVKDDEVIEELPDESGDILESPKFQSSRSKQKPATRLNRKQFTEDKKQPSPIEQPSFR